ncbi:MAG: response regulator transcription factor [Polyangia bacterium]
MRVLIVEDDRKLASFLVRAFTEEGYAADLCRGGAEAQSQARALAYDLIVLDWMLPDGDGLSVCRELRRAGLAAPILMLTARGEVSEKVLALDSGVDDYLTKPFHLDELMARARSLLRRASGPRDGVLRAGPLALDPQRRMLAISGRRVELTGREYSLLALLLLRAGRVVTRSEILEQVWGLQFDPGSNVIEVHMRHLREKLGEAAAYIETVRGQGYRLSLVDPDRGPERGPERAPERGPERGPERAAGGPPAASGPPTSGGSPDLGEPGGPEGEPEPQ